MSPAIKYTLARVGLFAVCAWLAFLILPQDVDQFLKLLLGLVVSLPLSYVLLRRWREEMADHLNRSISRSRAEKARLRAALAGEDEGAESGSDSPTAKS